MPDLLSLTGSFSYIGIRNVQFEEGEQVTEYLDGRVVQHLDAGINAGDEVGPELIINSDNRTFDSDTGD